MMQAAEKLEQQLDYTKRETLITEVKESFGIEFCGIGKDRIEAFDEQWGREVSFRFLDNLGFEEMFEFNKLNVNKERVFEILKKLDPTLFMTVKKVVFINNKWDYNRLVKEFDGYDFLDDDLYRCIGKHLFFESYVFINMVAIKKMLKEMEKEETKVFGYFDMPYFMNRAIWETLTHELQHTRQQNPLYENEYEDMDDSEKERDAEDYCREIFKDIVEKEKFYIV